MYYIRKSDHGWLIRNNHTGQRKKLSEEEIEQILVEFPNLKNSKTVTYFRNNIKSINDLP